MKKMEINQALSILSQAIDMSVAGGAFKTASDVAVVNAAKETVVKFITEHTEVTEPKEVSAPKKAK
jgi:hypothetical protein